MGGEQVTSFTSFKTGNPAGAPTVIFVEGYGLCQFVKHFENGDVQIYVGGNRMFRIADSNRWRYAK